MKTTAEQRQYGTRCDRCTAYAVWAIADLVGTRKRPITRWMACGRHLNQVLAAGKWTAEQVQVLSLRG